MSDEKPSEETFVRCCEFLMASARESCAKDAQLAALREERDEALTAARMAEERVARLREIVAILLGDFERWNQAVSEIIGRPPKYEWRALGLVRDWLTAPPAPDVLARAEAVRERVESEP